MKIKLMDDFINTSNGEVLLVKGTEVLLSELNALTDIMDTNKRLTSEVLYLRSVDRLIKMYVERRCTEAEFLRAYRDTARGLLAL